MLGELFRHLKASLTEKSAEEVVDIKNKKVSELMQYEIVNGVGTGIKKGIFTSSYAIEVFLNTKPDRAMKKILQKKIEGVPVVYKSSGKIAAK
jgi:hypothetical protein